MKKRELVEGVSDIEKVTVAINQVIVSTRRPQSLYACGLDHHVVPRAAPRTGMAITTKVPIELHSIITSSILRGYGRGVSRTE